MAKRFARRGYVALAAALARVLDGGRAALGECAAQCGAAPGQSACLLRGDVIVGWATISA